MKEFLETTLGKVVLGIIVVTIWGWNVINISELGDDDQVNIQEIQSIDINDLMVPSKVLYEYKAVGRDPFKPPTKNVAIESFKETKGTEEVILPPLELTGILEGMAIITDQYGSTHFVTRNEKLLESIHIMHIWQDSVLVEYLDTKFTLKLNKSD